MEKLTFEEKVERVNDRARELMRSLYDMHDGLDVDFNEVVNQLLNIHKDELRLLRIIEKYEKERNKPGELKFPDFLLVNKKGA